ncbi:hypothetical protein [Photobacterium sp. GSS17]|uniref:hypothetical protein n=1 Tax=Photobacterium sp. GSS17 TaxID=3020715 RepID=UPI00235F1C58|nr:hypothetical protein [Photobacterium sp. GSS17]
MAKVTIHLSGYLAQLAGRVAYAVEAGSVRDALESLQQFPKLNPDLTSKRYVVKVDECPTSDRLDAPLTVEELHIRPQPESGNTLRGGSGKSGAWLRIVVGAVLVVVGVVLNLMYPGNPFASAFIGAGIGMILGGVFSLLFPVEEPDKGERQQTSAFSYTNTTKSGTPIPIILGRHKWAGQIIAFNVDSVEKGASVGAPHIKSGWKKLG